MNSIALNTVTLTADALFQSFSVEPLPCNRTHILVACFPKSGSTWLSEILSRLPSFHKVDLVPVYDRREQELAFERLILFHALNYVAQHHCRFSSATERCLNAFSIKPIILIRNIFDCIVSAKDHMDGGEKDSNRIIGPCAYVPQRYYSWSDAEKYDFIIDLIVPWYFNFFVGWRDFQTGTWASYEELVGNPLAAVKRIANELHLDINGSGIEEALVAASKAETRKNVGEIGRGSALTSVQKNRVRRFASYYPSVDFSTIGL
jgi:Sulfotransferase domain